jgi:hypothetical protein
MRQLSLDKFLLNSSKPLFKNLWQRRTWWCLVRDSANLSRRTNISKRLPILELSKSGWWVSLCYWQQAKVFLKVKDQQVVLIENYLRSRRSWWNRSKEPFNYPSQLYNKSLPSLKLLLWESKRSKKILVSLLSLEKLQVSWNCLRLVTLSLSKAPCTLEMKSWSLKLLTKLARHLKLKNRSRKVWLVSLLSLVEIQIRLVLTSEKWWPLSRLWLNNPGKL